METKGNTDLLQCRKIGYFASGTRTSLSVLPTLDWATEVAKREELVIVSGFHSKMEREVLDILLKGRCGIICVLARPIYKSVPEKFRDVFKQGRLLFISHNNSKSTMTSRQICQQRNEYVASVADELVFSSLTRESSLYPLCRPDSKLL